jgi:hypothetical protein
MSSRHDAGDTRGCLGGSGLSSRLLNDTGALSRLPRWVVPMSQLEAIFEVLFMLFIIWIVIVGLFILAGE